MSKQVIIGIVAVVIVLVGIIVYALRDTLFQSYAPEPEPVPQTATLDPNEHGFFDIDFARKMVIHHQQAIEMTDAVLASSKDEVVRDEATEIRKKQTDAETQYKDWLNEWGEDYNDLAKFPQMDGHDMYPSYPGLVSAANMRKLNDASAENVDTLFMTLVAEHHNGALELDKMNNKLQYGELIEFKDKVFADYKAELQRMKKG